MGAKVTVAFQGVEEVIARLSQIEEKGEQNLVKQTKALSDDGKAEWKQNTPEGKTKRLRGEEDATPSGLSITFKSPTFYYKFVDEGHKTRRRRDGKPRSFVKGREMTPKLVEWLRQNTREYLSKFLDGV